MKKRNLFLLSAILYVIFALLAKQSKAQNVGINSTGATPNNSAMLDVDVSALATKKGLLIPRVTAAQKTAMNPLPAAAQGLVVYQTDGVQGFYYNTSVSTTPAWSYIAPSGVAGWSTLGNTGTIAGTNFIGTTDAIDFVVKANNTESFRVAASNRFIGIGITIPEERIHLNDGNMLLDNEVAIRGRSGYSGAGASNIVRVMFDDIEIGSNSPMETFRKMKLYVPYANGGTPDDGSFEIHTPMSMTPYMTITDQGKMGINITAPEEVIHIDDGNMLLDNEVAIRGRSGYSGAGASNIVKVMFDDIEIGSNSPMETFRKMKLYVPYANGGTPDDGSFEIHTPMSMTPFMTITDQGKMGINITTPEEVIHIDDGNMLMDNEVAIRGRSGYSGAGASNIVKVMFDDIEIGSNSPMETFRKMKLYVPYANGGTPNDGSFEIHTPMSMTPFMTVTDQGKMGINNSSPSADVDILGTFKLVDGTQGAGKILVSNASGNASWQTPSGSTMNAWGLTGNSGTSAATNFIGTTDAVDVVIKTTNTERMRVNSSGNVGIGTTTPTDLLHLKTTVYSPDPTFGNRLLTLEGANTLGNSTNIVFRFTGSSAANCSGFISSRLGNTTDYRGSLIFGVHNGTGNPTDLLHLYSDRSIWAAGTDFRVRSRILSGENFFDGQLVIYSDQGATDYTMTINPNSAMTQNIIYNFPPNDGNANDVLTSDGAGNLTWTAPSSGSGWGLTGNAGTTPATNFVGTTDAVDLVFRTNNTEKARITSAGNIGVGTTAPSELFHVVENNDVNKHTVLASATQISTAIDYQNVAVTGIGKGGNATWGYGIGVLGVGDQAGSWRGVGVYASLGSTILPPNPFSDAALLADGQSLGYAGVFLNGNVGIATANPTAQLDVNGTTKIGTLGTVLTNVIKSTNNVDVGSVAAGSSLAVTYTVTNAATGSTVSISPANALTNGLIIAYARVSAANTVEVKFTNVTGAAIDPAIMDYYITVIR